MAYFVDSQNLEHKTFVSHDLSPLLHNFEPDLLQSTQFRTESIIARVSDPFQREPFFVKVSPKTAERASDREEVVVVVNVVLPMVVVDCGSI